MLNNIVNIVGASAKRHSELKLIRQTEIEELQAAGRLGIAKGANQIHCLQRPGIRSLIDLFGATKTLLKDISHNRPTTQFRGEAEELQRKSQDIVKALNLVASTKMELDKLRNNGWNDFIQSVQSFCE
ncbi:unnamed protein product [Prunus armeniaca]